ncbi:Os02g0435050 [Oryza sativa Japonica Group]|uniref:Os02g0435050 protein n=1 Tax=Oryza sativa subsp. japonica TaxID=39947 RepID=A0A0P0VIG1_ORYSJ|nr:Os02g0435050 [Oryza sativa Japonica Group]
MDEADAITAVGRALSPSRPTGRERGGGTAVTAVSAAPRRRCAKPARRVGEGKRERGHRERRRRRRWDGAVSAEPRRCRAEPARREGDGKGSGAGGGRGG